MYRPPQSILSQILEAAFLFALAAWLVRTGIKMIDEVWVPLLIIAVIVISLVIGLRIWKHYKDTHF